MLGMNPWLTQNLADQRRADMVKAATQWRLTHNTVRASVRSIAGRWLIEAGEFVAGSAAPNRGAIHPAIRLGG